MSDRGERELAGELAAATLRVLRETHAELNYTLFGDLLRAPSFSLGDSKVRLGSWDPALRTLEISEPLLLERGWGAAIEVLKHEMAHQFVHEQMPGLAEGSHGPTFRRVCQERGIDARAAGDPADRPDAGEHPVLARVRKLLSLAQSANEHEAQSAASIAQRLMLRHNIDQVSADRSDGYAHRQLGRTTARTSEAERLLGSILQEHFFVDVIWVFGFRPEDGKKGRVMEVCGRRENVALAEYVHAFLSSTAARLWEEHRAAEGIRHQRDRRAFLAGVMAGFFDKLASEKKQQAGRGLVWRGDPALSEFFKRRHPSFSMRAHYESADSDARKHGRRAGRQIVLHRGISRPGTRAKPKQLR